MLRSVFAIAVGGVILAAGASGAQPPTSARPTSADTPGPTRAEIGHAIARRLCAGCHEVEAQGMSPNPSSPPFRVLADRYGQVTLGRKLDDIATGHYKMPPTHVSNDDIDSLVEYLGSFRDPWAHPKD